MNYNDNLEIIKTLSKEFYGTTYWMSRSHVYGAGCSSFDVSPFCGFCKYFCATRGVACSGAWLFKKIAVYMPANQTCSRCSYDGKSHDLLKSDDPTQRGETCKHFESLLPSSYDGLPKASFDILS